MTINLKSGGGGRCAPLAPVPPPMIKARHEGMQCTMLLYIYIIILDPDDDVRM